MVVVLTAKIKRMKALVLESTRHSLRRGRASELAFNQQQETSHVICGRRRMQMDRLQLRFSGLPEQMEQQRQRKPTFSLRCAYSNLTHSDAPYKLVRIGGFL